MFSTRENRCRRFQSNIFNKSKCKNCFKTVDSHKLSEADLYQSKPVQVGWLLLAPECIDFSNPGHRKRKWQRRYFVLYEHGLLRYSLDEMAGTLPQGSVNMTQCCELLDASSQTGFQNCLRLCFTERDFYIKAENAVSISRWQENLIVYPKAAKSNQRKKKKDIDLLQTDELQTSSSSTDRRSSSSGSSFNSSIIRRGSLNSSNISAGRASQAVSDVLSTSKGSIVSGCRVKGSGSIGTGKKERAGSLVSALEGVSLISSEKKLEEESPNGEVMASSSSDAPSLNSMLGSSLSPSRNQFSGCSGTDGNKNRLGIESGYSSLEKTSPLVGDAQSHTDSRRSRVSEQQESLCLTRDAEPSTSTEQNDKPAASTPQVLSPNYDIPDLPRPSTSCSFRSKSLERTLDRTPTPDLLNFKKGWMSRLGEDGKWRKHWFVLTDQTLRFYQDSVAEEAADVDGEINLSTCYDVTDYPVQRNYGFQIHTKDGVFTLCAMTYGIRRNWVQAVMKNIRPTVAPDVTCSVPQKAIGAHTRTGSINQYNTLPQEEEKRSRIRDRRKEGRYKTFDWAELSCKQNKEELSSDLSGREWNHYYEHRVPPAPASSPEGPVVCFESVALGKECPQKTRLYQSLKSMSTHVPSHSTMVVTNHTSPGSISPDSLEVDAASVRVYCDSPGDWLVKRPKKEKKLQVDRPTSPMLVNFSSSSVQTEWQWEVELQSLRREIESEQERSQTQESESKLSESRLQGELNDTQDCLRKAELRTQEAETLLKEREGVLEDLQRRLDEVTGCLKSIEEAQALKEVRLQRHLRLLQESQERERRSFSDSLDQSEQRLKELEERLRLKEAELDKRPTGEVTELVQRCQELQNQLEESDCEVGRLQARLHTEETLYYDMEHDYERACEETQGLRGALQDCERVCEERFQTQLERKQQDLDRKERELQEVLVKMAVLGSSLEETERRLKEAQTIPPEVNASFDTMTEPQCMLKVSNIREKMIRKNGSETQPIIPGEESDRVISVIQALELKLCDTEDRLRELTIHLQQQKLNKGPHTLNDSCCGHTSIQNLDGLLFVNALPSCTGALNILQGKAVLCENPGSFQTLNMISRVLSLEALVIQRMASALEHPSTELLSRLSDLRVNVFRMSQGGNDCGAVESRYSQIFLYLQEQDQTNSILSEDDIQRLCVRAELAYLIHTVHTHSSQEQQGSGPFNLLPWPVLDSSLSGSKKENESKQGYKLADISPSELAPYSEQMEELAANLLLEDSEVQLAYRKNLAAELHAQAQSLQDLSTHLQSNLKETGMTGELPASVLKVAMCQAALAYMACRLRSAMQQEMSALCKQREQAEYEARAVCRSMEVLLQEQTELYEEKLLEGRVVVEKVEQGHVSAEVNAHLRVDEAERLQVEFEEKLQELQKIHEEEMSRLHKYYIQNMPTAPPLSLQEDNGELEQVSITALQVRIRELQSEITFLKQELSKQDAFQLDLESVKATYEHAFSLMEESHQRVIDEMQRQHQREVERLTEERERVLQEETNATIAAIEAMRKAHKEEMDKTHKAMQSGANVDICQLHAQYNEELESLHRELEVLSEQYSQKCIENTHLTQTMEAERDALGITQRENQELHAHNRELNECLAAELSLMHSRMNGEVKHTQSSQEKDVYQLEVNLRVKESEIKCLKQEITSLKLELQAANTHFKELQLELSALGVKTQNGLRIEPGRKRSLKYDLMKSRSNPDCSTHSQAVGSKSLKDGLTVLERMKLFELTGTQKT
ncbi:myosin phosphatase Rho-interacting protein isoform X3 [Triplophysa dalaica]|uniref:myosin phosphatase Rho-interacting protein isoform X3 n=1 Tax=Triplophysa dalaica TaxID=1582913 RepID=UPI0024E03A11|nr:myosin phosphatase Rho-interacting protein isoform X3 [Triplophysa dalaica]